MIDPRLRPWVDAVTENSITSRFELIKKLERLNFGQQMEVAIGIQRGRANAFVRCLENV